MSDFAPGTVELAFLGCGEATRMHSRTLSALDEDVRLHYASRDLRKAEACRDRHGGGRAYGAYHEALADPAIDVALVATPPATHLELTVEALEAGKDVIVEKPAFPGLRDFGAVRSAISRWGGRVLVAENYRYKPVLRRLRRVLDEGLVGEPLLVQVNAVKWQEARGWRGDPDLAGGGGLLEGGIHWIDFMAGLGPEVRRATGFRAGGADAGGPAGAETVVVVLEYAGGAVGTLSFSWEVPSPLRGLRISKIYGREGTVTFESNGVFVFVRGRRTRLHLPGLRDIAGYRAMFTDFLEALRTGAEPEMTLAMAERDLRLVQEAYNSAAAPADRPRSGGARARGAAEGDQRRASGEEER